MKMKSARAVWQGKPMEHNLIERPAGVVSWVERGTKELAFLGGREARAESEKILEALFKIPKFELYFPPEAENNFEPAFFPSFKKIIEARKKRIPLAYLLKQVSFWEDELEIEEGVFIPRPETEILIETFLKKSGFSRDDSFQFLDWGTGSGNIAVTVAKLFPKSTGVGLDLSEKALAVSARNAKRLGVSARLCRIPATWPESFKEKEFDIIFSNPPYIPSADCEKLEPEVQHEPRLALDGGPDGLDFYRTISGNLTCLKPGGSLWVEIGLGQSEAVSSLFKKNFDEVEVFKDLNQIDRVVSAKDYCG